MFDIQLKKATFQTHIALERRLLEKIYRIQTTEQYVEFLSLLFGFYDAVENAVGQYVDSSSVVDFGSRRKAKRLLDDMSVFSASTPVAMHRCDIPTIKSFYSALGALYVMEGSTLGGRVIARIIARQIHQDSGFSFFYSYGNEVEQMWLRFKQCLQQSFTDKQQSEIIETATLTFIPFNDWITQNDKT